MANKKFIQKRLGYIMSPPQKVDKPFVALITFSMTLFISMCLMGFTMQYSQEQHINPYVTIDYAEKVQSTQWMPFDNDTTGYNLTERGEYIIEQLLYPNTVNYIEDEFLSHSGNMKLTLLESDSDVLVYLYNSANKEYPIMLVCLDQSLTPQTFSGLSYDYLYILGLIVDESSAKLTRILVSE